MATATASLTNDATALPPSLTSTEALQSTALGSDKPRKVFPKGSLAANHTIEQISNLQREVISNRVETSGDWTRFSKLHCVRARISAEAFPDPFAACSDT
jgi:hypothetical protein